MKEEKENGGILPSLVSAEQKVLQLAAQGLSDKLIALQRRKSLSSATNTLHYISKKWGIAGRLKLVLLGLQKGEIKVKIPSDAKKKLNYLNEREKTILLCVNEGITNNLEIARKTGLSEGMVHYHKNRIFHKLGIFNSVGALPYALYLANKKGTVSTVPFIFLKKSS